MLSWTNAPPFTAEAPGSSPGLWTPHTQASPAPDIPHRLILSLEAEVIVAVIFILYHYDSQTDLKVILNPLPEYPKC